MGRAVVLATAVGDGGSGTGEIASPPFRPAGRLLLLLGLLVLLILGVYLLQKLVYLLL